MSALFFCYACGHSLLYISDRRLKCYGCGKYFTLNFVCRCRRKEAFKYSSEIIAANKAKCLVCGKETTAPCHLKPPYFDRAGTNRECSDFGVAQIKSVLPRKPASSLRNTEASRRQVDFQPDIFDEKDKFSIIGELPFHQKSEQVSLKIENGILIIKSLLEDVELEKRLVLPKEIAPETREIELKNCVLEIRFKKRRKVSS